MVLAVAMGSVGFLHNARRLAWMRDCHMSTSKIEIELCDVLMEPTAANMDIERKNWPPANVVTIMMFGRLCRYVINHDRAHRGKRKAIQRGISFCGKTSRIWTIGTVVLALFCSFLGFFSGCFFLFAVAVDVMTSVI